MINPSLPNSVLLLKILSERFNEAELRTLAFQLGINYEDLQGDGKTNKARELIDYLSRRQQLEKLILVGKQTRPDISWNNIGSFSTSESELLKDGIETDTIYVTTNIRKLIIYSFANVGQLRDFVYDEYQLVWPYLNDNASLADIARELLKHVQSTQQIDLLLDQLLKLNPYAYDKYLPYVRHIDRTH